MIESHNLFLILFQMWDVYGRGRGNSGNGKNDPDVGAAWLTDSECVWYVGLDGDSMIGVGHQSKAGYTSDYGLLPRSVDCVIAGTLHVYSSCDDIEVTPFEDQ